MGECVAAAVGVLCIDALPAHRHLRVRNSLGASSDFKAHTFVAILDVLGAHAQAVLSGAQATTSPTLDPSLSQPLAQMPRGRSAPGCTRVAGGSKTRRDARKD